MVYVVGDKSLLIIKCSEVAQWWSRRLLTARSRVRAPPSEPIFLKMPIEGENPRGQKAPVKLSARSTSEADSACAASVSPSLGANFFQLFRDSINYLPEWRNWQTHRT